MVVSNVDGSGYFLHIKEGVTKGSFLSMIAYGIGIFPLIHDLRTVHPHVMQLWYAENVDTRRVFDSLQDNMRDLLVRGPPRGYFLEPTKSILVIYPRNFQQAEDHLQGIVVWVVVVRHYLGGFISDQKLEKAWLSEKVKGWTHLVEVLAGVALRHPHTAYAGLNIPSRWSGFSSSALPRTPGRHSARWRRPWINPSSQTFSRYPPQMSCREGSPACPSSRCGWRFQTQLCPPGRTVKPHVLSRYTWLQLSEGGQSSKQGITPCSCGRAGGRSGSITYMTHKLRWRRP